MRSNLKAYIALASAYLDGFADGLATGQAAIDNMVAADENGSDHVGSMDELVRFLARDSRPSVHTEP